MIGFALITQQVLFFWDWIVMGQYASTQPCATKFRRSVCTIFMLDDENGHNISNRRDCTQQVLAAFIATRIKFHDPPRNGPISSDILHK